MCENKLNGVIDEINQNKKLIDGFLTIIELWR